MHVIIRVGQVLADLEGFNRVAIEKIGSREFLIGTRHSGRKIALFALREGPPVADYQTVSSVVMTSLSKTLDTGRRVCLLTTELNNIDEDQDAMEQLDAHNASVEKPHATEGTELGRMSNA